MKEKNTVKDVSVSQRQIYILSLLSENPRGYQVEDIRTRLHSWDIDVSRRTILRDIDELSLNYGIMEEERDGKTYFWADKYTLKNVDLTIEDLASLAFAKKVMGEYSHLEMGRHAISFIDKVVENSASLNKMQFDKLMSHFKLNSVAGSVDTVDREVEMKIQNAIDNKNKIQIEYYSFASDEVSQRIIHPYGLLLLDSYLCMEGFCELRNEIRRFRLSRIEELRVLDEQYTEDVVERKEQPFLKLLGNEEEDIRLIFYGESARYIAEYEAGRAKSIEKKEDGLHFYQKAAVTDDVVKWIRGFGLEVKVVSPAWLSEQLLEEARERVRIYDN